MVDLTRDSQSQEVMILDGHEEEEEEEGEEGEKEEEERKAPLPELPPAREMWLLVDGRERNRNATWVSDKPLLECLSPAL